MHHTQHKILLAAPFTPAQVEVLKKAAPSASFWHESPDAVSSEMLRTATIIIGNVGPARLLQAKNLQWLQLTSAGYDTYAQPEILPKEVLLTNASGAYGQAVSEHMVAMLLGLMKNLPQYRDYQNAHVWKDQGPAVTISGAKVLVLGLGDIGRHFSQQAAALGAEVTGIKRTLTAPPQGVVAVKTMADVAGILPTMDVVASFLPGGAATRRLLDSSFFAQMKNGSYFLNAGRGEVVDTDALYKALVSGHLAGAGLDVTDPEPLPADNDLWDIPSVLITPHVAGGFHLPVVLQRVTSIAAENLTNFMAKKPLKNVVQREP